jgi:uncharacterized protein
LQRATQGIDRFLTVAAQIGIRPAKGNYDIYAPHGLDDLATLTIRPNLCPNFSAHLYEAKVADWKARWPELTVLPAANLRDGRHMELGEKSRQLKATA